MDSPAQTATVFPSIQSRLHSLNASLLFPLSSDEAFEMFSFWQRVDLSRFLLYYSMSCAIWCLTISIIPPPTQPRMVQRRLRAKAARSHYARYPTPPQVSEFVVTGFPGSGKSSKAIQMLRDKPRVFAMAPTRVLAAKLRLDLPLAYVTSNHSAVPKFRPDHVLLDDASLLPPATIEYFLQNKPRLSLHITGAPDQLSRGVHSILKNPNTYLMESHRQGHAFNELFPNVRFCNADPGSITWDAPACGPICSSCHPRSLLICSDCKVSAPFSSIFTGPNGLPRFVCSSCRLPTDLQASPAKYRPVEHSSFASGPQSLTRLQGSGLPTFQLKVNRMLLSKPQALLVGLTRSNHLVITSNVCKTQIIACARLCFSGATPPVPSPMTFTVGIAIVKSLAPLPVVNCAVAMPNSPCFPAQLMLPSRTNLFQWGSWIDPAQVRVQSRFLFRELSPEEVPPNWTLPIFPACCVTGLFVDFRTFPAPPGVIRMPHVNFNSLMDFTQATLRRNPRFNDMRFMQ